MAEINLAKINTRFKEERGWDDDKIIQFADFMRAHEITSFNERGVELINANRAAELVPKFESEYSKK